MQAAKKSEVFKMTVNRIKVRKGLKVEVSGIDELVVKPSKKEGEVKVVETENVCVEYDQKENVLKINKGGNVAISGAGGRPGIVAGGNVTFIIEGSSGVQMACGSSIVQNQSMSGSACSIISVPPGTKIVVDEDVEIVREYGAEDQISIMITE